MKQVYIPFLNKCFTCKYNNAVMNDIMMQKMLYGQKVVIIIAHKTWTLYIWSGILEHGVGNCWLENKW